MSRRLVQLGDEVIPLQNRVQHVVDFQTNTFTSLNNSNQKHNSEHAVGCESDFNIRKDIVIVRDKNTGENYQVTNGRLLEGQHPYELIGKYAVVGPSDANITHGSTEQHQVNSVIDGDSRLCITGVDGVRSGDHLMVLPSHNDDLTPCDDFEEVAGVTPTTKFFTVKALTPELMKEITVEGIKKILLGEPNNFEYLKPLADSEYQRAVSAALIGIHFAVDKIKDIKDDADNEAEYEFKWDDVADMFDGLNNETKTILQWYDEANKNKKLDDNNPHYKKNKANHSGNVAKKIYDANRTLKLGRNKIVKTLAEKLDLSLEKGYEPKFVKLMLGLGGKKIDTKNKNLNTVLQGSFPSLVENYANLSKILSDMYYGTAALQGEGGKSIQAIRSRALVLPN